MFPRLTALGGTLTAVATGAAGVLVAATLAASPATAAPGTGTGWLHTSGNKIVDSTGATVRITGIINTTKQAILQPYLIRPAAVPRRTSRSTHGRAASRAS